MPTNRKKIQRIYRKIGWIEPQKSKREIIRASRRKRFAVRTKPALGDGHHLHPLRRRRLLQRPGRVYPSGWPTSLIRTTQTAIQSVLKAATSAGGKIPNLRTDNGPQYSSREFCRRWDKARVHLEEHAGAERARESFHGTLKREYVWPHEFARFQDAEVILARAFADSTGTGYTRRWDTSPPTNMPTGGRVGINESRNHSEISAKSGNKKRGPDQDRTGRKAGESFRIRRGNHP